MNNRNGAKDRAVTYGLLAHIRSQGQLVSGPVNVFTPLIKHALSRLNNTGIFSGKSITEIKSIATGLYGIDFPIPALRTILASIAKDINTPKETKFLLFQDDSFQIKDYAFTEFEETIKIQAQEIANLERLFREFCQTCGEDNINTASIFEFIEKNKLSLSKYLAHKNLDEANNFTVEAQFVYFFRQIPAVYDIIRNIYLGSIIVGYIEYKLENVKTNIELLLDTNFILGLLDLNTPESTHTCRKVIEITKSQGYKLSVLNDTLIETKTLLKAKVENFDLTFLQKRLYPEDIYNACNRRNFNSTDLERMTDKLEMDLSAYGIQIINETTKYRNKAKFSNEYEALKKYRHSPQSALHDATAIYYVRDKRRKKIRAFEDVNCWFINNSVSREKYDLDKVNNSGYQPESIRADDFLNIIWLSNPQIDTSIDAGAVKEIGLAALVSAGLTGSLPKLSIIKELDDNIHKYSHDSALTDSDIVKVATRITTRQLSDLEGLNKLARENKELFVKRLNEEARKQKELDEERIKKLDIVLKEFTEKSTALAKLKKEFQDKSRAIDQKLQISASESQIKDQMMSELSSELENEKDLRKKQVATYKAEKKGVYIENELRKWRSKTNRELYIWIAVLIIGLFSLFWMAEWKVSNATSIYRNLEANVLFSTVLAIIALIFSGITLRKWYDKNHNYSNIENFKKNIKIPE